MLPDMRKVNYQRKFLFLSFTQWHLIRRNKTNVHKIMPPIQSKDTELNYSKDTELKREKNGIWRRLCLCKSFRPFLLWKYIKIKNRLPNNYIDVMHLLVRFLTREERFRCILNKINFDVSKLKISIKSSANFLI